MPELIVFPDAITIVGTRLRVGLPDNGFDLEVHTRVPNPRPDEWVRVDRAGGVKANLVTDAATVIVEAWAQTEPRAHAIAQMCRALIHAMEGTTQSGVPVYRVGELAGPTTLPDPESGQPRATQTLQVNLRGFAA